MKKLAVVMLVAGFLLLTTTIPGTIQYAIVDYGMHHQTGVLCFDYERGKSVYHYGYNHLNGNDTGVDNIEDYWRTSVDTDGGAVIKGYSGYLEI